ncbi:group-specific protein [Streptomyces sp. FXJ1.4098]|uniref:group-specific protein n=1 Tax=Streptomyces sp. NPDC020845 TaxID=3365096 RepID=UPI00299AF8BF|nr:group-specific protein [Streptomyces sp. FXJ1.4098]
MGGRRLKLVRQVRYAPTENGAAVLGPSGALALRGAGVYAWLERLWPLLDGAQDVDAVLAQLPDGHRAVATRLLETLQRRDFLREATEPRPHGLTATELHRHRHEIAYIGHWLDSPEHRFERYRTARVLLLGDGPLYAATRHALLACGLRQVLSEDASAPYDTLRAAAHTADAVVYAGDATTPQAGPGVAAVERACGGVPLFRALSRSGDCWLLPPTAPLTWADVRHRIRHTAAPDRAGPTSMTAAAAALVGGRLALAVFRLLTGIPDEDTAVDTAVDAAVDAAVPGPVPGILRVDLATLATHRHRVLPAPRRHDSGCAAEGRMKELREAPAFDPDELTARLADCADDMAGPYAPPTTEYGSQIPLTVAQCLVAGAGVVVGVSLDPRAARAVALRRAGASYALSAAAYVPPRSAGQATPDPVCFRAERLADGGVRFLPAPLVLPCPAGEEQPGRRPAGAGTACAESWDTAVEAALFGAVRSLARRRAADVSPATPMPEGLLTEPEAVRHWRLLRTLGPVPEVRDLSGGLAAPVIGLVAGDRLVSVGCAATAAGALAEAARELLLARQRGTEPAAGTLPLLAAPGPLTDCVPASLPGSGPREHIAHLATSLAAAGYTAYAVPLDHDADFHTLIPFVARVVLDEAR